MSDETKVSIIIPYKAADPWVEASVASCRAQTHKNVEIILLPDSAEDRSFEGCTMIPTGPIFPATKRNLGIAKASGEILAFLDSDARAEPDWLANALKYFDSAQVGTVGGPNLTPPEDDLWQHVSGYIFSSSVGGGPTAIRYKVVPKPQAVKELPSCNLLVRRELFKQIGGFDEADFLTAEDAKACYEIENLGLQNLYVPDAIVYHHRRQAYKGHLRQAHRYGFDKALLVKELPSPYAVFNFLPLVFLVGVVALMAAGLATGTTALICIGGSALSLYLLAALVSAAVECPKLAPLIALGIVLTHVAYAWGFLKGLTRSKEKPRPVDE